jgi:hypothetical protein
MEVCGERTGEYREEESWLEDGAKMEVRMNVRMDGVEDGRMEVRMKAKMEGGWR